MNLDLMEFLVEIIYLIVQKMVLDEYCDIGTHWVALYKNNKTIIYFDSFRVEHIPKKIIKFIGNNKKIITNIYRIQTYDSIMCGYFCI